MREGNVALCQSGVGCALVMLGAHVRVLTPSSSLSLQWKLCDNIKGEVLFDVHVKRPLCSHRPFS